MAKRYNVLTRCLAALALFFVYFVSTSVVLVGATTSSAQAQWRGRGGGWGRGRGYGFYGGPVVVAPGPRCWWTPYGVRRCRW